MTDLLERLQAVVGDRYTIERELGRGGMATVYLAQDLKHRRQVAIKVLQPELSAAVGGDRFLREIEIAAQLTHPHILPLHDSGEGDGLLYYVMPYVEGESLRDRMDREGQLPLEDALAVARDVGNALAYAHSRGVVHRDIKPENVMLTGGLAVVADFGIALAITAADEGKLTATGVSIGTPLYMSPEQGTGSDRIDGRSDLYSLACVLYEMLAGEPPFQGSTAFAIIARHSLDAVPPVRTVRPAVPHAVEEVLSRALAKTPADRYATVEQFIEALRMPSAGHPAAVPPPEPPPAPRARIPRHAALAVGAALVLAGIGYGATTWLRGGAGDGGGPRVVVLPFDNKGQPEDEYFADGLTEAIIERLSNIRGLGVIARTSAMQYKATQKSIREIGNELRVQYAVEGTVDWRKPSGGESQVRVVPALIKVSDQTSVSLGEYDVRLAQVFDVEASIAEQVAGKLNIALNEPERRRLAEKPTESIVAYDHFLRANAAYRRSWQRTDVLEAARLYQRAVEEDPQFALAFARLGRTYAWLYQLRQEREDRLPARLEAARAAIDRALALDSTLADAHIALGLYHYWGHRDYQRAIDELITARELQPGNALAYNNLGNVQRRLGQWDLAAANYTLASDLDPRAHVILFNLAEVYTVTRQYDLAEPLLRQVLAINPDFLDGYLVLATVAIHRAGNVEQARVILQEAASRVPPDAWRLMIHHWRLGLFRIVDRTPDALLQRAAPGRWGLDSITGYSQRGEALLRAGRQVEARAAFQAALALLERRQEDEPGEAWVPEGLAEVYAGLGRTADAIREGERAVALRPVETDALDGPDQIIKLARIYVLVGRHDEALDRLERALTLPSRISARWVSLDPAWEPLRDHPRFKRLVTDRLGAERRAGLQLGAAPAPRSP